MTPIQYAKQELAAGRFPVMSVQAIAGSFYLCDKDWNLLSGSQAYRSKEHATTDRSRILDRARRHAERLAAKKG